MEPLRAAGVDVYIYKERRNPVISFLYGIRRIISKPRNNVLVLTGGDLRNVIWFLIARIFTNIRLVIRFGGDPVAVRNSVQTNFTNTKNLLSLLRSRAGIIGSRFMLKHADGAIVVSDYLADRVRPMLGPNTRLAIAPPVLLGDYATKSDYRQKQDVFSVLTIANMNYTEKADGAIIIAEAMKKASQDRPETRMHLDIVGGGLQLKRLQNVITGLQMPDNITITVHGQQNDVARYYETADIFVYHSTLDSFPLVLLEAAAHGLPIALNRWGPFPDLFVDGKEAAFYETGNTTELAGLVGRLADNEGERAALGRSVLVNYEKNQSILSRGKMLEKFFSEVLQ